MRFRHWIRRPTRLLRDDRAAQMVEFACTLPLMVLFVVGIFDFSGAFTLRQKLTNIARDAARAAASDPGGDIASPSTPLPASISDAFQLVDNYLIANHLSDCGISPTVFVNGPTATYQFTGTSTTCPPGGMTIYINRGYYFSQTSTTLPGMNCGVQPVGSGQIAIVATCVSIRYAYKWRFGGVASLFGSTTILPTSITGTAVAMNEN
jgi:Flp pilus assembly protein TadG